MAPPLTAAFDRLLKAPAARQPALARDLVAAGGDWAVWREQFNRVHGANPEREVRAARALSQAFGRAGDAPAAARFGLLEARALQRAGSPKEAERAFEKAAVGLDRAGESDRASQARVMRVDALALAGRVDEAVRVAESVQGSLRGAWAKVWKDALRINLANALRLRGDLDGALTSYDAAAKSLAKQGQKHTEAIARMNAAVALMDGGRAEDALARFEAAAEAFEATGKADMALEARYNRACALVKAARLGEGVVALTTLAGEHEGRGLARREALCRVDLADALLRAGDAVAARNEAELAAKAFAAAGAAAERCEALLVAATATPSPAEAVTILARARSAAVSSGREAIALRCELAAQDARLRATAKVDAGAVARLIRRAGALGQEEVVAEARLLLGEASLRSGRTKGARRAFAEALRAGPARPWIRAAAESGLASCLAREGRTSQALARLRKVAEFLDAVRGGLPGPWLRATFVLRRLDPWLERVELLLARGEPEDRREAEALLDALASRRFLERAAPKAPKGELAKLRKRLEALYDRIGRGAGPTRGPAAAELTAAETEARQLERQVAELWRLAERSARATLGVDTARPRTTPLPSGTAALHVWTRHGRALALLRTGAGVLGTTDLGAIDDLKVEMERLRFQADRVRLFGPEGDVSGLAERLHVLGRRLLALLDLAPKAQALRLVLDPVLPDLPWEMLPHQGHPLCARLSVLRVPCLSVRRPARPIEGGTTYVASGGPDLPGVALEAQRMADAATVLAGEGATRAAFLEALGRPGVVHVAGHGFTTAETPALGGVRLVDGWVGATDVPPKVEADVVVLAACRSGVEHGSAAQAWGALPVALLSAGARRVLWTAEDVDDRAGAELAVRFHAALAERGAETAFGRAVSDLWADPRNVACLLPFHLSGVMP